MLTAVHGTRSPTFISRQARTPGGTILRIQNSLSAQEVSRDILREDAIVAHRGHIVAREAAFGSPRPAYPHRSNACLQPSTCTHYRTSSLAIYSMLLVAEGLDAHSRETPELLWSDLPRCRLEQSGGTPEDSDSAAALEKHCALCCCAHLRILPGALRITCPTCNCLKLEVP